MPTGCARRRSAILSRPAIHTPGCRSGSWRRKTESPASSVRTPIGRTMGQGICPICFLSQKSSAYRVSMPQSRIKSFKEGTDEIMALSINHGPWLTNPDAGKSPLVFPVRNPVRRRSNSGLPADNGGKFIKAKADRSYGRKPVISSI